MDLCGRPIQECTMPEAACTAAGWVHADSRLHHCERPRWLKGATGGMVVNTYAWPLGKAVITAF